MTPLEYQKAVLRTECENHRALSRLACASMRTFENFTPEQFQRVRLNHAAAGIAKEAGELLSLVVAWNYYGKDLTPERVADELGDILWFVALACEAAGLDIGDVMEANVAKLRARYPEKFSEFGCASRDRRAEKAAVREKLAAKLDSLVISQEEMGEYAQADNPPDYQVENNRTFAEKYGVAPSAREIRDAERRITRDAILGKRREGIRLYQSEISWLREYGRGCCPRNERGERCGCMEEAIHDLPNTGEQDPPQVPPPADISGYDLGGES